MAERQTLQLTLKILPLAESCCVPKKKKSPQVSEKIIKLLMTFLSTYIKIIYNMIYNIYHIRTE